MRGPHPARAPRRRTTVLLVGIASSAFFLWFVLRQADVGAAWLALKDAERGLILAAAVVIEFVYVAQALRWRVIASTPSVSRRHFLALVLAGIASNNVLPLRIGDLLRSRWLATAARIPTGRGLGTVFRDRLCDVVVLLAFLLVTIPFVGSSVWERRIAVGGAAIIAVCAIVIAGAVFRRRRNPQPERDGRSRLLRVVDDLLHEIASPIGRKQIAAALALSVVAWLTWAASAGLVCRSLGIHLSAVDLVFVTSVINLGVVIPSAPGFIGTYQWLSVSALATVGVDADLALAFALLMQGVWYLPTTVVGGPIALHEGGRDLLGRRHSGSRAPSG